MIRGLRRRFVLLSMLVLLLVLSVILTAIHAVNYRRIVANADTLLGILLENRGSFPPDTAKPVRPLPPGLSPETPFESRYFSVTLDGHSDGVVSADLSRIASVDEAQALACARTAVERGKPAGFVGQYRYALQTDDPYLRVVFLDCGRQLGAFTDFLWTSVGISLAGCLVVFALIAFFSRRIVRPIAESYEKQRRFITDAGHELRTPLSIIRADADVLALELEDSEWLADIRRQTDRLAELTDELVYLSRMEEAGPAAPMTPFPFSDVVGETAASFQALAQTRELDFDCRVQPLLTLCGDEKAIRRLVSILLDNALKYTPAHGVVALTAEKQGRNLRLCVCNTTAEPIPAAALPRLFDRFYRPDPSRSARSGGYGIGLSVASAIVRAHGGRITAAAEPGQTLRMTVTLPGGG